jgi:sortase A
MSDRRTVNELTVEELEQLLIIKRREARAERMRRLREIGRLPVEAALPHEDLAAIEVADIEGGPASQRETGRRRDLQVEPLQGRKRKQKLRKASATRRRGRLRDRALLVLEIGALVGLVTVLAFSLWNLNSLNSDYADASQVASPVVASPTALAGGVLPSGHTPPEEPGRVPAHLRDLVEGAAPPPVVVPTPGPEAPTRIVIPTIDVDALIVKGDTWDQLKLGVGHHLNTANPGERGNMVLAAHNDIYGEIFRELPSLELGDEVVVYAGEQPFRYLVTAKQIVEPAEVEVMAPTTRPVATLISCYPYMVDTHRIVVVAELQ